MYQHGSVHFNQQVANDGSVGIWHETYLVNSGQYETVYCNMPPYGLTKATQVFRLPVNVGQQQAV